MADPGATLLARIAGAVGDANVLTAPADMEPYLTDWRGRYRGAARAVVRPGSTDGGCRGRARCARTAASPIVPQGGNTGLCGGAIPDAGRRRGRGCAVAA